MTAGNLSNPANTWHKAGLAWRRPFHHDAHAKPPSIAAYYIQPMNDLFTPLTAEELQELDHFLLSGEVGEAMMLDMVDGFLHAIGIGPSFIDPRRWLEKVWGHEDCASRSTNEKLKRMSGLVMRHYNSIVAGLEKQPREINPYWSRLTSEDDKVEYDDAEGWTFGFMEGTRLCWKDWQPMLSTTDGQAWFRPIVLLSNRESSEQVGVALTPNARADLARKIPRAVLNMHAHFHPLRSRATTLA